MPDSAGSPASHDRDGPSTSRSSLAVGASVVVALPGVVMSLTGLSISSPVDALLYGLAIVGAAFLLSWAAEAAQVDISAGLAIALLALVAVLPEYAVDFVFTLEGGHAYAAYGPSCVPPGATVQSPCGLALANMTGANRILVGVGWALVVLLAALRLRGDTARGRAARGDGGTVHRPGHLTRVTLARTDSVPLVFLLLATIYSLTLPLRVSITLVDLVVLVGIFVAYSVRVARAPAEEPELIGPSAWIGAMETSRRRGWYGGLFVVAAVVILLSAEHFANALVDTGTELGVSQFFLVQWIAPLASEAPELLIAGLYAWRLRTTDALATLVSSKVNQWSLLVGTLPLVFALASGSLHGLPIDPEQRLELLLTATQSLFAVALLVTLSITMRGAIALVGLFAAQFVLDLLLDGLAQDLELVVISGVYVLAAIALFVRQRVALGTLLRDGLRTPYSELTREHQ
jgi:cation:H+ antiporter